jgi:hypothetical protein
LYAAAAINNSGGEDDDDNNNNNNNNMALHPLSDLKHRIPNFLMLCVWGN